MDRDFKDANGNQADQFYTRMGVNHKFLGQQSLKVNDSQFNSSLLGTRGYYGLGCDRNIMENLNVDTLNEKPDPIMKRNSESV